MPMHSAKHDVKLKTKITFENKAVLHVQYLNRDLRQYFTPEKCYCGGFSTNNEMSLVPTQNINTLKVKYVL